MLILLIVCISPPELQSPLEALVFYCVCVFVQKEERVAKGLPVENLCGGGKGYAVCLVL